MKKFYFFLKCTLITLTVCFSMLLNTNVKAQDCSLLTATFKSYESRCASTGSIKVIASGGSGSYKYKVSGPVNSNFTTTDSITGLSSGSYTVEIKDINTNCTFTKSNVIVSGTYLDPRFTLLGSDITCEGGSNGSIAINSQQDGRSPFQYSIVAPSPMGVGTNNATGSFNNLTPGDYSIRLTDSCGGIQTRLVTIHDYTWRIDSYDFTKVSCDSAKGYIKVIDSKGNISTAGGIPGFNYGIVRQPGDTIWSASPNLSIYVAGISSFEIIAKDNCGKIKKGNTAVSFFPSLGATVNIYNNTCDKFSASVNGVTNFFNASFCLYNSSNVQIACNATGVFTNIPYGSYCIVALDGCTNSSISRCFTASAPALSIGNNVGISNKTCTQFTASITGQAGLTNPNYCLYNSASVLITCNATGVFNNLSYGSYSITMHDGCRDTTIQRSFSAKRPVPGVNAVITPSYITCTNFGLVVTGDSLTTPDFCLYNSLGTLVVCNTSGKFDSIALGSYCVKVHDACLDTTFTRCFTVTTPLVTNDISVAITNTGCNLFTATVTSSNLKNANYSLYNSADSFFSSNSTGIFTNIGAGSYYIKSRNGCPDTTFKTSFSISIPIPSVNATAQLSNYACGSFSAAITNQQNLTSPQFCIYNNSNVLITCNSTGVFDNLSYGAYCIKITNSCFDTVIARCFTAAATPLGLTVTSSKSCTYGASKFDITVNGATPPISIKVYNSAGILLSNKSYGTNNITIENLLGVVGGQTYKFTVTDNCGRTNFVNVVANSSYLNHSIVAVSKCPGGVWPNGSGNIEATVATNLGALVVEISAKNGVQFSPGVSPNSVSGSVYHFDDLGPATYILRYRANAACSNYLYDTVVVNPYTFPSLQNSTAYQCDVNGFTVGAVATNGVSPFSYSIIGSAPETPAIIAGPQANPLFNIDNGTTYSLIRLRALDACGNATLGDASILPLADNKIVSSSNCFIQPATLNVDPMYNSTYNWYKKADAGSTDSTLLSRTSSVYIPTVMPSDTGLYICHIAVGTCISRTYNFNLTGSCAGYSVLNVSSLEFAGNFLNDKVLLNWKSVEQENLSVYVVERKNHDNTFSEIGRVMPSNTQKYYFTDQRPDYGNNFYRLKLIKNDNTVAYSKIITVSMAEATAGITLYPNPVTDFFTIDFKNLESHVYKITLMNINNQVIREETFNSSINKKLEMKRNKFLSNGIYLLRIVDSNTNQEYNQKVIFK